MTLVDLGHATLSALPELQAQAERAATHPEIYLSGTMHMHGRCRMQLQHPCITIGVVFAQRPEAVHTREPGLTRDTLQLPAHFLF